MPAARPISLALRSTRIEPGLPGAPDRAHAARHDHHHRSTTTALPLAPGPWALDADPLLGRLHHPPPRRLQGPRPLQPLRRRRRRSARPSRPPASTATIDVASLDTGNADRDAHVLSPDLLDVTLRPTLTFRSTVDRRRRRRLAARRRPDHRRGHPAGHARRRARRHPGVPGRRPRHAGFEATTEIRRKDFGIDRPACPRAPCSATSSRSSSTSSCSSRDARLPVGAPARCQPMEDASMTSTTPHRHRRPTRRRCWRSWPGPAPSCAATSWPPSTRWCRTTSGCCWSRPPAGASRRCTGSPPSCCGGAGAGPTLVVSPLLALMRNQVAAAAEGRHPRRHHQLGQHRRLARDRGADPRRRDRRAAHLARAAEQPPVPGRRAAVARRQRRACW